MEDLSIYRETSKAAQVLEVFYLIKKHTMSKKTCVNFLTLMLFYKKKLQWLLFLSNLNNVRYIILTSGQHLPIRGFSPQLS